MGVQIQVFLALAVMAVAGAVCAPLGVRLARRMNDRLLRDPLAVVIICAALVIAWPSTAIVQVGTTTSQ